MGYRQEKKGVVKWVNAGRVIRKDFWEKEEERVVG